MYEKGFGIPQDSKEAATWYRLAAGQGYMQGQTNLGALYAKGQGVPQDFVRAYMWLSIAEANNDQTAADNKRIVSKRMTTSQIEQAIVIARQCQQSNFQNCDR